jgi:hypothetical protein
MEEPANELTAATTAAAVEMSDRQWDKLLADHTPQAPM